MFRWKEQVKSLGKPEWNELFQYTVELHRRGTHPPAAPFPYAWEEVGVGYCYGPAFGHWDIVHIILDALPFQPIHAKNQILNNLQLQGPDGMLPGTIWLQDEEVRWSTVTGHPPLWPAAVQEYYEWYGDLDTLQKAYTCLLRQIDWFEKNRSAGNGFYYSDLFNHSWESGVDDGIRFDWVRSQPQACVDATAHVFQLYDVAVRWASLLNENTFLTETFMDRADHLKGVIQNRLFDEETGMFHDDETVGNPDRRHLTVEGIWPIVVGAATRKQAQRVVDEHLLNPSRFWTRHPIPSVAMEDPGFEWRMWRGASWNSMAYWAARGCIRYGYRETARRILERALDATSTQFHRTGTVWEFYHPDAGDPLEVERKPYTEHNHPCKDYVGHSPLLAMGYLWSVLTD